MRISNISIWILKNKTTRYHRCSPNYLERTKLQLIDKTTFLSSLGCNEICCTIYFFPIYLEKNYSVPANRVAVLARIHENHAPILACHKRLSIYEVKNQLSILLAKIASSWLFTVF